MSASDRRKACRPVDSLFFFEVIELHTEKKKEAFSEPLTTLYICIPNFQI